MSSIKFTVTYPSPAEVVFEANAVLIKGEVIDDRGEWSKTCPIPVTNLKETREGVFEAEFRGEQFSVSLRSSSSLTAFLSFLSKTIEVFYLDLTTLPHHIWAPILKHAHELGLLLRVIYAEPLVYTRDTSGNPHGGFDLSERVQRLRSIPGFVSLGDEFVRNFKVVVLLGFEGRRFEYIVSNLEPEDWQLFPIIGVPGFQPGFVDHVFNENSVTIEDSKCAQNIRYSSANCPFLLIDILQEIANEDPDSLLKIAPLGTKPHALGAFLFGMTTSNPVRYVYDHPVRKVKRSKGLGVVHIFDVSKYLRR